MRTRSQRHLASARGSSLLAWLPRPGRGARSPPARRHLPAPVSRSRLRGEAFAPLQPWDFRGGCRLSCAPQHSPGRGTGARVCPGRGCGSSRAASPLGEVTFGPFSSFFPTRPAFPPVPRARPVFPCVPPWLPPVCLLAEPVVALASQRGPAVPRGPPARHRVTLGRGT